MKKSIGYWTSHENREYKYRRAAAASLLIVLLHSFVDYPLRTPLLACVSAACLGLLLISNKSRKRESDDNPIEKNLDEKRHVII